MASIYNKINLPLETRIVSIHPGQYDDPLVCTLSPLRLSAADEPYDALSYCWRLSILQTPPDPETELSWATYDGKESKFGTKKFAELQHDEVMPFMYYRFGGPRPPGEITLCSSDGNVQSTITVGGELHSALRRFRKADERYRLWIDALCINQNDNIERNEHVKIMGSIYERADCVRVWLGEEVGTEQEGLDTLIAVSNVMDEIHERLGHLIADVDRVQYEFVNNQRIRELNWSALVEFLERAWVGTL
jgi:hypothetical protein